MTAPGYACCAFTTATTKRPRSSSSTTSARNPLRARGHPNRQRRPVRSQFHWHILDRGIRHIYIKPATPRLNGKVERSPYRQRRILRAPRRRRHRRHRNVQRQTQRMAELLQLRPTPRSTRWTNPIRTNTRENNPSNRGPAVSQDHQLHIAPSA